MKILNSKLIGNILYTNVGDKIVQNLAKQEAQCQMVSTKLTINQENYIRSYTNYIRIYYRDSRD